MTRRDLASPRDASSGEARSVFVAHDAERCDPADLAPRYDRRFVHRLHPARTALLAVCALPLAAQTDLEQAVADLANPQRRERASRVLDAAGAAAVPLLRNALLGVDSASALDAEHVTTMLRVLSRHRRAAVPALAAVERIYTTCTVNAVREQAAWVLARIATATGDDEVCERAQECLLKHPIAVPDSALYSFAWHRLELGPDPSFVAVHRLLANGGVSAAAAASAACDQPELEGDLAVTLERALGFAVARPPLPWLRYPHFDAAAGELAAALWQHGHRGPHIARGLLRHWDAERRHLGLTALVDPTPLSAEERIDVLSCLWDDERHVREQAMATLHGYGRHGLFALRALRAFERHANTADAETYRRAAIAVVRTASVQQSEAAADLLRQADHILGAQPWQPEGARADEAGCQMLVDIVLGCRGTVDDTLASLAQLAVAREAFACRAGDALLTAFVGSLGAGSEDAWRAAVRALAAIGPPLQRIAPQLASTLLVSRTTFDDRIDADSAFVAEAAILAGRGASDADVLRCQTDRRWHVALRALVEAMRRGLPQDTTMLRELLTAVYEPITAALGQEFAAAAHTSARAAQQPDQPEAVRLVAALALALENERPWTDPAIAQAFAEQWSIAVADVGKSMQDAAAARRLPELALQIETALRRRLRWPEAP